MFEIQIFGSNRSAETAEFPSIEAGAQGFRAGLVLRFREVLEVWIAFHILAKVLFAFRFPVSPHLME